jgi:hypothetical protein
MASKTIPQLTAVTTPADDDLLEISQGGASFKATAAQVVEGSGLGLSAIADGSLLANTSGSSDVPVATTTSELLDATVDDTQGAILYRNATEWVALAPGTAGQVLTTGGAGADPSWAATGASSSSLYDLSAGVPIASTWTWYNQGSATRTDSSPSGRALLLTGQGGTGVAMRGLYKAVPSTPYTLTALIMPNMMQSAAAGQSVEAVFGWTDTTKLHVFQIAASGSALYGGYFNVARFTNSTTFSASESNTTISPGTLGMPLWLQVSDDGTNVIFRYSVDSVFFTQLFSVAKASGYLGSSGYTNLFWGLNDVNQTSLPVLSVTLRLWDTGTRSFP